MDPGTTIALRSTPVIGLEDPRALEPDLVGAKAAALARAAIAGLPVLPGAVLTTAFAGADLESQSLVALRELWTELSANGELPLVVRSSSSAEDTAESSMAGRFTSVLGVRTWDQFRKAVDEVIESGIRLDAPIAVLIQPELDARIGGVMFTADPVSGSDRLVVAAVSGGPDSLVSGEADGARYTLTRRGRVIDVERRDQAELDRTTRRALADLAAAAEASFGGPQDIEWAFAQDDELWLLQSRPITATGDAARFKGPILGPGPIAETFPEPLAPLEDDLWLAPLRAGLIEALLLAGVATRRAIGRSPVVITIDGRPAVDLGLLGATQRRSLLSRLDPLPKIRRVGTAWRVGRLRMALPALARDVADRVDDDLARVPSIGELGDTQLLSLLDRARRALMAMHGYEVLAGLLMKRGEQAPSGVALALHDLAAAREEGLADEAAVASYPRLLGLSAPAIGRKEELPPAPPTLPELVSGGDPLAGARESLRLRIRWVQELSARASLALGERLASSGAIAAPEMIRWVRLDELEAMIEGSVVPIALDERIATRRPAPLPAEFRLSDEGLPIPVARGSRREGRGVSAGRALGPAATEPAAVRAGDVLVVRTLDPSLATILPDLAGLVAETGSVLSHLAILAREYGIPTVVGIAGALERFPAGSMLVVDGATGEVRRTDTEGAEA